MVYQFYKNINNVFNIILIVTQHSSLKLFELQEESQAGGSPNNNKRRRKTREEVETQMLHGLEFSLEARGGRKRMGKPTRKTNDCFEEKDDKDSNNDSQQDNAKAKAKAKDNDATVY